MSLLYANKEITQELSRDRANVHFAGENCMLIHIFSSIFLYLRMHAGRPQMFGSFSGSVKISKCTR